MKGPEAFRTISEAAAELGVPQHVLRFWETKFSFIRPMKRAGGRRFYRRQDIEVLRGVRILLHEEGYTIKGVQRLHKELGVRRLFEAAASRPREAAMTAGERGAPAPSPAEPRPAALSADPALDPEADAERSGEPVGIFRAAPEGSASTASEAQASVGGRAAALEPSGPIRADLFAPLIAVRPILSAPARERLQGVLTDLEAVKARLDALLA